jgi:hypothetical protein
MITCKTWKLYVSVPGVLKISALLDHKLTNQYNLTVIVSDGVSSSGLQALNDTATVYVSVFDMNGFILTSTVVATSQFHVTEATTSYAIPQVSCSVSNIW